MSVRCGEDYVFGGVWGMVKSGGAGIEGSEL